MNEIYMVLGVLMAYLIGSFSSAVWIGKWFYRIDVRTQGSGNAGATNTFRVLGWKPGAIVLLLDAFKGWFAVSLASYWLLSTIPSQWDVYYRVVLAVTVVFGHVYPIYTGFKGGKGVATLVGVLIALFPMQFGIALLIFIICFICFRYVSLASIVAAMSFPFIVFIMTPQTPWILKGFSILLGIFIPFTHRKNIARLRKGMESKFFFKKRD